MIENQTTEFKLIWQDDAFKNVCAFANTGGGIIYIGINDKGVPVGVENPKRLLEILPNIINQKTGIFPVVSQESLNGTTVVKISIPASSVPISYNGRYFSRSGSVVLELAGRELGDFLLRRSGLTWDALAADSSKVFDPDDVAIELFKRLSVDRLPYAKDEKNALVLLEKLNLLVMAKSPTRAAILLFDRNPQRHFPQAIVKIGRFINESDIVSSDIIGGNLFQQAESSLAILKTKYLLSPITYEGTHRREQLEYPFEALREAVFNALIHRDYNSTSAIQIKVYQDKLSIVNEGKFPPEVSIDDLKREHLSKPRNPLLADIFYKTGFIESWGRGTLKIIRECKAAHIPEPLFSEEHGVVRVEFSNKNVVENVVENDSDILIMLTKNPMISAKDIAVKSGKSERTIQRKLKTLQAKGKIKRVGPDKGGQWVIGV